METPHQRILYAMSGMVLSGDYDLLSDLRQHATEPGYFAPMSDSHYVAEALPFIGGEPTLSASLCNGANLTVSNGGPNDTNF